MGYINVEEPGGCANSLTLVCPADDSSAGSTNKITGTANYRMDAQSGIL